VTNPYSMPQAQMTEAVSNETYQPKFFALNGRIGRVRYLGYSFAASMLLMPVIGILMAFAGVFAAASGRAGAAAGMGIFAMVVIWVLLVAVGIILARRRLHDLGQNGWLSLLTWVPLVGFVFWLWLVFGAGDEQSNEYGPPPAPNSTGVIVLACVLPLMIFVGGILAAIAIPAYQSYVTKARAAQMELGQ